MAQLELELEPERQRLAYPLERPGRIPEHLAEQLARTVLELAAERLLQLEQLLAQTGAAAGAGAGEAAVGGIGIDPSKVNGIGGGGKIEPSSGIGSGGFTYSAEAGTPNGATGGRAGSSFGAGWKATVGGVAAEACIDSFMRGSEITGSALSGTSGSTGMTGAAIGAISAVGSSVGAMVGAGTAFWSSCSI